MRTRQRGGTRSRDEPSFSFDLQICVLEKCRRCESWDLDDASRFFLFVFIRRSIKLTMIKSTTGWAGLPVHPQPRQALLSAYQKTLDLVQQMPAESIYRQSVERFSKERMAIVESTTDLGLIESKVGQGQVEQLLLQAIDEQALAERMLEWKPWEPLKEQPPVDQWS